MRSFQRPLLSKKLRLLFQKEKKRTMDWNVSDLFGKLQQLQQQFEKFQQQLTNILAEGEAGGGMVKAQMNGAFQLVHIDIDPSLLTPEQKQMLEDLIVAAVNVAQRNVAEKVQQESQNQLGMFGQLSSLFNPGSSV